METTVHIIESLIFYHNAHLPKMDLTFIHNTPTHTYFNHLLSLSTSVRYDVVQNMYTTCRIEVDIFFLITKKHRYDSFHNWKLVIAPAQSRRIT